MANRRDFLRGGALGAAGLFASRYAMAQPGSRQNEDGEAYERAPVPEPEEPGGFVPVEAPDLPKLPWRMEGGVKVFKLIPMPVKQQFVPWRTFNVWGFNGSCPGPTIECFEGDRVRIEVENRLPEGTVMHWHGLEVPFEMDGIEGLTQDPIPPGGHYTYEFTLHQNGTFFYHSHRPMQQMMGMVGLFVIHPRTPHGPRVHRDFGLILQEWAVLPNNNTPNTLAMEFNWLTINGKAGPAATPMLVRLGERVRLRMVNLSMDHHPMHIHGNTWVNTGNEGGRLPRNQWEPGNTVIVGVAQARDMEFDAVFPGEWMLHCHLPHHMMNAMASMVGPVSEPAGGIPAGHGMEEGMGMLHGGHALSDDFGPSLGRTIGVDLDQRPTTAPLHSASRRPELPGSPAAKGAAGHQHHAAAAGGPRHEMLPVAPDARQVPGYPQDMFMLADELVAKPETFGLRPTWTGGMMGMMTLVRVLRPEMWTRIQELKARQASQPPQAPAQSPEQPPSGSEHQHGGGR